jgi:energy-coupling factor transporter transmembrane protein EcfT
MKNPRGRSNFLGGSHPSSGKLKSLIAVATFVLIIASLYWAQAVLVPIALAIMLTFLLTPVASALERIGLGRLPSVILIVVLTFSLLGGIGWIVTLGRWGAGSEDSNSILLAGADKVGTTMIETREQMIQLSQISPHSEAHSVATADPLSPPDETFTAEVRLLS